MAPFNSDLRQRLVREHRLAVWRSILAAARPVAPAVSWPINQYHVKVCRKAIADRQSHIFEISTGAMQHDDRRSAWIAKLQHMQPATLNRDEPP